MKALAVVAGGLVLGAGGFGLVRMASAEPVPAAPPQFRPAADPVVPAAGVIPPAPTPAAIPPRPGDVLPVPELPVGPRTPELLPPPSDAPAIPVPTVQLSPPKVDPPKVDPPKVDLPKLDSLKVDPPKLDPPKADPIPVPVPKPVEVAPPAPPAKSVELPTAGLPSPPDLSLRTAEPSLNVKPAAPAPGIPTSRPTVVPPSSFGDAPMPLNLLATAKAAVLGTAMLAAPLSAQDAVKKADFEAVQKDVKDIKDEIASLKSLGKQLKELKDTLEGKTDGGKDDGVLKAVKRMDDALAALDKKVQSLENKVTDFATRTAGSSPLAGGAAPAPAPAPAPAVTTAKVKIVNEYPVQISMLVNGVPHRVEPNSTVEVPVSAGSLRYQLLTAGANEVPSVVRAGETVTLRVK